MNVSYRWLQDYCDFELSPEELARLLSLRGVAVEAVTPVGNDYCLTLEITANRPDLLSHIGVAREIAAITGSPLRIPDVSLAEDERPVTQFARVEVHLPDLCPRYTARVLHEVKVAPAPDEMRRRLETVGIRPVNNVVDITNYVLMECGQPEHAFDLARLRGGIIVRPAILGETLRLIDGSQVRLTPDHLVIADTERPVALAGIMGGIETEIGEATRTVLLESARFDPANIRRTCRSTGKSSDSSYRFERGVDIPRVEWASRRAASLIQQHAGARLAAGVIDVNFTRQTPRTVRLRVPRIARVLGVGMTAAEAGRVLKAIGFGVRPEGTEELAVAVPSFRPDVEAEIDLIEEVARCRGYDTVPDTPHLLVTDVPVSKPDRVSALVRRTLVLLGYNEAVTTSFLSDELAQRFSPWTTEEPIRVHNPLRSDEAAMRRSLVPSLLGVARTNQDRGSPAVRLFEVGRIYLRRSPSAPATPGEGRPRPAAPRHAVLPDEKRCLTILAHDDFFAVKGTVEAVLSQTGVLQRASFAPITAAGAVSVPFLAPGAAGVWRVGASVVGYLGELSEDAVAAFRLRSAPCVAELDLDAIAAAASLERRCRELPRFPAVARDLAIIVCEETPWAAIAHTIQEAGAEHLEEVTFREVYRGPQIEPGKKGVFLTIVYRAPDRTLTHDEVNVAQERVVDALAARLGAVLRA